MFLDQRVLAVERNGVEIQVEGPPAGQAEPAHSVEPAAHQLGIAGRGDPATVLGEERALGDDIQPGEEGQPLIQHRAHDMAVTRRARELQRQERPHRTASGDHLRAGETCVPEDPVPGDGSQNRREEEQAAELGAKRRGAEVQLPDIGDIGDGGARADGAFVIGPAWQASQAFLLEDMRDGDRTKRVTLMVQVAADVVDREILLAECDDPIAERIGLGCGVWSFGWGPEEVASGILAKLMDEDAEASRCITEPPSGLSAGESIDKIGPKGLVLAMSGVGGFEEDPGEIC